MRRPALPVRAAVAAVRRWSPTVLVLRLVLLGTGAAALAVARDGATGVPAAIAVAGVLGLLAAVPQPQGAGPAVVLAAAALSWAARHGTDAPPVRTTLLLAGLLAVHHQVAALAAALPATARVDRAVLTRFGAHLALVLALSGLLAGPALAAARPGGSVPLEVAGLVAAVLLVAVLVGLGRAGRARRAGRPPAG